jgi:hypothetical protein
MKKIAERQTLNRKGRRDLLFLTQEHILAILIILTEMKFLS